MNTFRKQARFAGLLYLLSSLPAPFGLIYVPRALIVPGDATATADRVRASATLLRMGVASELYVAVAFAFLVLALYRLLKGAGETLALTMVTLFVASVPISFIAVLHEVAALFLASGAGSLSAFDGAQLDALVSLFLHLHGEGVALAQIFWGLWLFPFGLLVMRSGFIPRALGVILMLAGVGNLVDSCTSLFLPQYAPRLSTLVILLEAGEFPMMLWLLIWGVKAPPSHARAS